MPLFGVTIGLGALRDRVASNLGCDLSTAEAILWQKLRRGEIVARCEWAYAAAGEAVVLTTPILSTEPWIMAERINWDSGTIDVRRAAKEVRYVSAVFFWVSELDFLDETHSAEELSENTPKPVKPPGPAPVKSEAIKERMRHDLQAGSDLAGMKQDALAAAYGADRRTVVAARNDILREFGRTIPHKHSRNSRTK